MLDRSLEAEFASYRKTLSTDEARRAFDERIERLLSQHGVDYVRGYVDALKDTSSYICRLLKDKARAEDALAAERVASAANAR